METLDLEPGNDGSFEDPPSSPLRLLLYTVGAVLVLLLGMLVVGTTPERRTGLEPEPRPVITTVIAPYPISPFGLLDTCDVRTDHRNYLIVSFWLNNLTTQPVLLAEVTGPPQIGGGVRAQGPVYSGGTCRRPAKGTGQVVLDSARSRLYTVRWLLPDTCPESSPLEVSVLYQLPGETKLRSDLVTVAVDLGGIGFRQCPKIVATEFPK
ncbi:hypothetical protein [Kineosporia babensis]|uniref:Uncharacterized protein n=1 Tax=Kineosporia babensis TaxID=499548 RepID=A0A9X1SUX0_9ACTN|nr:hypothetical protein [Kineosporia babensis]MCD5312941.1 hypothetical protein [Kineosporia babensis]